MKKIITDLFRADKIKRTSMNAITPIDKYLADVPEDFRAALEKLRHIICQVVPKGTVETVSYGIPVFKWNGMLVGFAAYKKHCSFFTCSKSTLKKVESEIKSFSGTVSAIHFTPDKPIPATLIKKIVKLRVGETKEKLEKRKKVKTTAKKSGTKKKNQ